MRGVAAGIAAAPAILRGARKAGDKPNLLFLWTDEQRADTLGAYGNRGFRVPSLNRLASESVVFERAYVAQPVCTPSRSCVMTGLWPHQNGCVHNNIPLPAAVKTLPELLDDAAYQTAYMGKWHLGDEIFAQHGFEEWKAIEDGYARYYSRDRDRALRSAYHSFLESCGYKPNDRNVFTRDFASKLPLEHSKPSFLANEASRFLLRNRREPWMLYVNFLEPHMPFSSVLNDLHSEQEAPLPPNYPGIPETPEPEWYRRRREALLRARTEGEDLRTRAGFQRIARNYAGLCSLVDQAVGRILWALEASGQAENTIIVFTSDHGDMMGAHSLIAKQVMYEEAVRVPLLLRAPFLKQQPQRIRRPVGHIDLVPTLLELFGNRRAAEPLPGRSLLPLLPEAPRADGNVFLEWHKDVNDSGEGPNGRTVVSRDGYKLVVYDTDTCLLFDHNKDPLEMNNVHGRPEYAAIQRRLRRDLDRWRREAKDPLALPADERE